MCEDEQTIKTTLVDKREDAQPEPLVKSQVADESDENLSKIEHELTTPTLDAKKRRRRETQILTAGAADDDPEGLPLI